MKKNTAATARAAKRVTLERTFDGATVDEVWDLWTTKDGIESWWGPEGFRVEVKKLDLRVGGELRYEMIAVAPEMVAFMKKEGMPVAQPCTLVYDEIVPKSRLGYDNLADFIPGVEPYEVATLVEIFPAKGGVRMHLTFDAMHDDEWTNRQKMGWEQEIGKLGKLLASRRR